MIVAAVLAAGVLLCIGGAIAWTARLLYIGNLDAGALAEKTAVPSSGSALDWPELHLLGVVPQPDSEPLVLLHVVWPAYPERQATLLVALAPEDTVSVPLLAEWCAGAASVSPLRRYGSELELRRRESLERVRAVLLAEDGTPVQR